ncbi:MAG: hypothetical protein J5973_04005, partial [Eubacterium sp.]|nr:hypothetical protein [Eubacterium sp.]
WRVLDLQDGKALLLADRMPDSVPFHAADEEVAWENSTLRSWLNGYDASANLQGTDFTRTGFIDRAFSAEEREAIVTTHCANLPNQSYGTSAGADTEDCLFLLSNAEVFESDLAGTYGFFPGRDYDDPAKRFTSTLYAKCMGAWWSPVEAYAGNSFWFMRTSGYTPESVTYVCDFGYIYSRGTLVTCSDAGVLPAMWIDLAKAEIEDAGETVSTDILRGTKSAEAAYPETEIGNPVKTEDESMPGGSYTVWNAVSFGTYPQTEILAEKPEGQGAVITEEAEGAEPVPVETETDPELYQKLEETVVAAAADREEEGEEEVTLDGIRYVKTDGRWFRCDPIIWRVLEVSDGTALLMTDRCLDSVPYDAEYKDVFWENSDLRGWLNGTGSDQDVQGRIASYGSASFLESAFDQEERQAIMLSDVRNSNNYYFGTACGSGTRDQVFILSEEEVFSSDKAEKYGFQPSDAIGDCGRRMKPTAYAAARGAWQSEEEETAGVGFWILRTNGYTQDNVVYVGEKGYLYNRGIPVTCPDAGIVPVIRVRLGAAPCTRVEDIESR